ncbi:MAG: symmetrical bis(5'-nucleosyl)-tetraphosphatase [Burkholderiaceae bacterium]
MNRELVAIGDLQGCLSSLQRLLARVGDDARLLFVGDIVNRGPQSLEALRFVRALGDRAIVLLGNHDLHLLAVDAGIRPQHADDTLQEILDAPDRAELIDWLRHRPLAHFEAGALFVHAGVLPPWTVERTLALAGEVEARLRADDYRDFLATMYGNAPARWDDALTGADRLRCVINALTRLRFVAADGTMDFRIKEGVHAAPSGFVPWFDHPGRQTHPARGGLPVVFGHWSTLGLLLRDDAVCLDTGCVWGGRLTAMSWPGRRIMQVTCPQWRLPG